MFILSLPNSGKTLFYTLCVSCLICYSPKPILAQGSIGTAQDSIPLFSSDEPLEFSLFTDLKTLKNDNSDNPEYTDGKLLLKNSDGSETVFQMKIRPRGYSRRVFDFCTFPPLKLNFKKSEVRSTVFHGQDKLKLVSYCRDITDNEALVLKEYLVYKIYNILTPNSYKVRLAKITYNDIKEGGTSVTRFGFLIEDDDAIAARLDAQPYELLKSNHDVYERGALDICIMFQYMIGNTDWWMASPKIHNTSLFLTKGGNIIPVPYDFDYSGLVDAPYATPDEVLGIGDVKIRVFRGYCRLPGTYEQKAALFNDKKTSIYSLIHEFEYLPEVYKKLMLKYLDDFYKFINDPKLMEKKIYDACIIDHEHLHKLK